MTSIFDAFDYLNDVIFVLWLDVQRVHCCEPSDCFGNVEFIIPWLSTVALSEQSWHLAVRKSSME